MAPEDPDSVLGPPGDPSESSQPVFAGSVAGEPPGAPPPEPGRAGSLSALSARFGRLASWEAALVVALVLVFLLGVESSSYFLGSYNLFTLCTNIGDLALMALPMTLIIMVGEIDLSVASTLALSGETLGYLWMPSLADGGDLRRRDRARRRARGDQRVPRDEGGAARRWPSRSAR